MAKPINDTALHGRIRAAVAAGLPVTGPKAAAIWGGVRGATGRGPTADEVTATVAFVTASAPAAHVATPIPETASDAITPQAAAPSDADGGDIIALARSIGLHGVRPAAKPGKAESQMPDADGGDIMALARRVGLSR